MEKLKIFYLKYKHAVPLIIYAIIYMTWFAWLEKNITGHYRIIHMAADDYIPFCEVFVIPYFLWFAYVSAVVIYFFFKNKEDYYRLCTFLFVGMTVFLVVSSLYPNGHYLRPHSFEHDNVFTHMVAWLYATDTPTNLFPSIHVYNSLGVHIAICNSKEFKDRPKLKLASFILMVSIILATMFLKQHSVFDVVTAFVMAAVMYSFVYGRNFAFGRSKAKESFEKQLKHI